MAEASIKEIGDRTTRSEAFSRTLLDTVYKEADELKKTAKLPDGKSVIERMMYLSKKVKKGEKQLSIDDSSKLVAEELSQQWIEMNVYPKHESNIAKKIKITYEEFKTFRNQFSSEKCYKSKSWYDRVTQFNVSMTKNAFDVRTKDKNYQTKLEMENGVKMLAEDELFYEDNCHGSYTAICQSSVSSTWLKQVKRNEKRRRSDDKKREEIKRTQESEETQRKHGYEDAVLSSHETYATLDPTFENPLPSCSSSTIHNISITTRSNDPQLKTTECADKEDTSFPKVKIRESRKHINENIIRCTVQCLADYKVTPNDLSGIIVQVANIIFGQNWELSDIASSNDEERNADDESDSDASDTETEFPSKRSKSSKDLTYVYPSRRTVNRYLEDASYMNLLMVAEHLINKSDSVVTVGLDDTTKAAGHKLYDVKTDHITVKGPTLPRKILTTGYTENISHSGADAAVAYELKLKCLAVLADTDVDEIKSSIDFWMTDRAGDCSKMLDQLGVTEEKILKCSAHVILGADNAADKVLKNTEQKIGVQKLLNVTAGERAFTSPGSSIHTLALIAISKLLSPSHASHSISLYNEYISWMESQGIEHTGFKGFTANRFGRIAEISKEFLSRKESIIDFFDAVVDSNSNKLVLAVSTYIQNEWFLCCTEVYSQLADLFIFPLMELLGIDGRGKDTAKPMRSWKGVKMFFHKKIPELREITETVGKSDDGQQKLLAAVLEEVIQAVERQLSEMAFFDIGDKHTDIDEDKLSFAPITNLGCESEFAKLDVRISASGGSTSVQTHSRKNIVTTNCLLTDPSFIDLSTEAKQKKWKWARTSQSVLEVKQIESNYLHTVKMSKYLSVIKKEELKKKKLVRTLNLLSKCKEHKGPVTPKSIKLLPKLTEKQLITEIMYLRATVAPDIRQQSRTKVDGKFKMIKFSCDQLKQSIKNAIKPEANVSTDLKSLLKAVYI